MSESKTQAPAKPTSPTPAPRQRPIITDCQVVGTQVIDDTAHYVIKVVTANETWCCLKRYSMFEEFHTMLLDCINERALPAGADLPEKRLKVWATHTSSQFLEERAILFENYLKKLCMVKEVAGSELFVGFLATNRLDINPASIEVKTPSDKLKETQLPEDVEVTSVAIPQTRMMSDHVLYQVDVVNERKRRSFQKWTVLKRFAQFVEMDEALRAAFAHRPDVMSSLPSLPEKVYKVIQDHMDDHFVEKRRVLLENYLQKLLLVTPVLYNTDFLAFLGVSL